MVRYGFLERSNGVRGRHRRGLCRAGDADGAVTAAAPAATAAATATTAAAAATAAGAASGLPRGRAGDQRGRVGHRQGRRARHRPHGGRFRSGGGRRSSEGQHCAVHPAGRPAQTGRRDVARNPITRSLARRGRARGRPALRHLPRRLPHRPVAGGDHSAPPGADSVHLQAPADRHRGHRRSDHAEQHDHVHTLAGGPQRDRPELRGPPG